MSEHMALCLLIRMALMPRTWMTFGGFHHPVDAKLRRSSPWKECLVYHGLKVTPSQVSPFASERKCGPIIRSLESFFHAPPRANPRGEARSPVLLFPEMIPASRRQRLTQVVPHQGGAQRNTTFLDGFSMYSNVYVALTMKPIGDFC